MVARKHLVDTIADLTSATVNPKANLKDGQQITVAGYYAAGDKEPVSYVWSATSTATADGGTVFAHDSGGDGRFLLAKGNVSVKDFGAKGDNATDDAARIQAAEDWANTNTRSLYWPDGNYCIATAITKKSNVNWFGSGASVLKCLAGLSSNQMLTLSARSNIIIWGMTFDRGARTTNVNALACFGLTTDLRMIDCYFKDLFSGSGTATNGVGLFLSGGLRIKVRGCRSEACYGLVIQTSGYAKNYQISENYGRNNRNNDIRLSINDDGSEGIFIDKNDFADNQSDQSLIYLTGNGTRTFRDVTVSKNVCRGRGVSFTAGGNADLISLKDLRGGSVVGNQSTYGGDLGIAIERCQRVATDGNTCNFNNTCGIGFLSSKYCTAAGNVCMNNSQNFDGGLTPTIRAYAGILVEDDATYGISSYISIDGNICSDDQTPKTQKWGIAIIQESAPQTNVEVGSNMCDGNAYGPYYNESAESAITSYRLDTLPTKGRLMEGDVLLYKTPAANSAPGEIVTTSGAAVKEAWQSSQNYEIDDWIAHSGNVYVVEVEGGGTTANAPVHTSGLVTGADGYGYRFHRTVGLFASKAMASIAS